MDIYSESMPGLIIGGVCGVTVGSCIGISVGVTAEIISGVYNGEYFLMALCYFGQCGMYSGGIAGSIVGYMYDFK